MAEDLGDKTEAPTLRRREDARRQGRIPRSADFTAAAVILSALLLMQWTGPRLVDALKAMLAHFLSGATPTLSMPDLVRPALDVAVAMLPLLGGLVVVALLANLVQVGFFFRLKLNLEAIDPAKGFERIFSGKTFARLMLDVVKLVVVIAVAYLATRPWTGPIVAMQQLPPDSGLSAGASAVAAIAFRVAIALLVLGVIDYAIQRWRHERDLRMTRRELKDEMRQVEGDPLIKRRRQTISAEVNAARLEREVASADVVVFDADQIAVALRYAAAVSATPTVVAKGGGALVQRLRELAAKNGVPVVERDLLARSLFKLATVGAEVPSNLFEPVAELLAYAQALRAAKGGRG